MVDFPSKERYDFSDYRKLVEILRSECPWDREQTHESIRRNTLEEAYELCGAIDEGDGEHLREELGDVLLHVLFHTSIEAQAGHFDLDDVSDAACKKLIFRHPHVFSDAEGGTAAEVLSNWDAIKEKERAQKTLSEVMEGVTEALPALWRAEKVQGKAAKHGKAVSDPAEAAQAIKRQLGELSESGDAFTAVGDLLYAVTDLARLLEIDPEMALHAACDRTVAKQRAADGR